MGPCTSHKLGSFTPDVQRNRNPRNRMPETGASGSVGAPLGQFEGATRQRCLPTVESRSGAVTESSVSRSRSSNRTCGSPASGFRTRVLLSLCPRQVGLKVGQPDFPQLLIKIVVGKVFLDPYPYLMLSSQPVAQPMSN